MPLYVPVINNLFRAWADVTTVAYAGSDTPQTVNAALNVASVVKKSSTQIEVQFASPLPAANYSVVATLQQGIPTVEAKTVNGFTLRDSSGGSTAVNFVVVS